MHKRYALVLFIFLFLLTFQVTSSSSSCKDGIGGECTSIRPLRYLFYDVNPPEGFNLRRDVYMRIAILVAELQSKGNWVLVLPPWPHLYHWRNHIQQERMPWSFFFDIKSLQKFVPVIELMDFLDMYPDGRLDQVYVLQHFEEMFKTGNFEDKYEIQPCRDSLQYRKEKGRYRGNFWGFKEISVKNAQCMSFHGQASLLVPFLQSLHDSKVMVDHAEVVLHDRYGDPTYWRARRSMRFAKPLVDYANEFRLKFLNSTDESDDTVLPDDWTREKGRRSAKGGPYVCVHLRRRDFVRARPNDVPTLTGAVKHIQRILKEAGLNAVFVATDAPIHEKDELEDTLNLKGISVLMLKPSSEETSKFKDGGLAIVDQIICSHARKFYGSHESTFSFRIQEEREIIGFPPETTFLRLCGDNQATCDQPSRWMIRY